MRESWLWAVDVLGAFNEKAAHLRMLKGRPLCFRLTLEASHFFIKVEAPDESRSNAEGSLVAGLTTHRWHFRQISRSSSSVFFMVADVPRRKRVMLLKFRRLIRQFADQ